MIRGPKRFWQNVDRSRGPDACWPWTKALNAYGYGRASIWMEGRWRTASASAVAYWLATGRWERRAEGRCVRHTCDHRACCNPRRLIGGTVAQNAQDAVERGRMAQGEAHRFSKLSDLQVAQIREFDEAGEAVRSIAKRLSVAPSTVTRIVRGYSRKSVALRAAARDRRPRGEACHGRKLTADSVREIRKRAANGEGVRALAREFDLSPSTVSRVVSRDTWNHLE